MTFLMLCPQVPCSKDAFVCLTSATCSHSLVLVITNHCIHASFAPISQITPAGASFGLFINRLIFRFRAKSNPVWLHVNWTASSKTCFQIKWYQRLWFQPVWGNTVQPMTSCFLKSFQFFQKALCQSLSWCSAFWQVSNRYLKVSAVNNERPNYFHSKSRSQLLMMSFNWERSIVALYRE